MLLVCLQLAMVLSFSQVFVLLMTLMTDVVGILWCKRGLCTTAVIHPSMQLTPLSGCLVAACLRALCGGLWPCIPSIPRGMVL
jgi:hypothetical protein